MRYQSMKKQLEAVLDKYTERKIDCEEHFDEDVLSLKSTDDANRINWLNQDIQCLNVQIGVYECIIKDIKELLKTYEANC